jgi:hypothetical protein
MQNGLNQCEFEVERRTDPVRALGPTLCGAVIRTAASGARLIMSPSNGFECIDSAGITRAQLTSDGLFALSISGMDSGMGYSEIDITAGTAVLTGHIGLSTFGFSGSLAVEGGQIRCGLETKIATGKNFVMGSVILTEAQLQTIKTHCGA